MLIGPRGLEQVVGNLWTIAPELPFELRLIELTEPREQMKVGLYVIDAFRVDHSVVCYEYSIPIPRVGRFDVERARGRDMPMKVWSHLQKGEVLEMGGVTCTPGVMLRPTRHGLKVAYCTDTRPVLMIAKYAREADLFICEGTYGEEGKEAKARGYKYMTSYETTKLTKEAQPKCM